MAKLIKPIIKIVGSTLIALSSIYMGTKYANKIETENALSNCGLKYTQKELAYLQAKKKYEESFSYFSSQDIAFQAKIDSLEKIAESVPEMSPEEKINALYKLSQHKTSKKTDSMLVVLLAATVSAAGGIYGSHVYAGMKRKNL